MVSFNSSDFLYDPSDGIVNGNLGTAITLTIVSSGLCGAVLLLVVLLRSLRLQPYQLLIGNYVSSSLSLVLGNGLYRMVQIQRYKLISYEEASKRTECGVSNFFNFPLVSSNYCLFVVGWERFIYLQFAKKIDWVTLLVFISLPWALGILGHSVYLADNSERYEKIPYLGLCIDITGEKDRRRMIRFGLDIVLPVLLAIVSLSLAGCRAYSQYREVQEQMRYSGEDNNNELLKEKESVMKVSKELSVPVALLCLRVCSIIVVTSLYWEYGSEGNSQDKDDALVTAAFSLLLLEVCIIPVVFAVLNIELRQAMLSYIPGCNRHGASPNRENTEASNIPESLPGSNVEGAANIFVVGESIAETSL